MKRTFVLVVLVVSFIQVGFSQTLLGLKTGGSITNITLNQDYKGLVNIESGNRIGYQLGLFAQRDLSEKMFMRTELVYAIKGYKSSEINTNHKGRVGFNYLSLPLLVGYKVTPNFSAFIGPEISALGPVTAKSKSGGRRTRLDNIVNYERLDLGASAGILYALAPKLSLDLRYTYGFSKILIMDLTDAQGNITRQANQKNNKVLGLSLNYFFTSEGLIKCSPV